MSTSPAVASHYLDHAATTPVRPEVVAEVASALGEVGNASSLHASGRRSRRRAEESREQVARSLGAAPAEVILLSGGTEADNLAVKGLYWSRRAADPRRRRILVSAVEHHAVLDAAAWLAAHDGAVVELLPVAADGVLRIDALSAAIRCDPDDVALVSCMWANNEVGTVQPVEAVVEAAHSHGIPVHSDAVQAVAALTVDFAAAGLDAMSVSGHKLGGPVGAGALVTRRGLDMVPLLHGGGQERDLRSGTLDVASARGLAVALHHAVLDRSAQAERLRGLRDDLERRVRVAVPDVVVNAADQRLPGICHLTFPGCAGDALLMLLDAQGVECSTGSACSAGVAGASHVLLAMGRDARSAAGSLRVSLGRTSTPADVDAFVAAIGAVVESARAAGLTAAGR